MPFGFLVYLVNTKMHLDHLCPTSNYTLDVGFVVDKYNAHIRYRSFENFMVVAFFGHSEYIEKSDDMEILFIDICGF